MYLRDEVRGKKATPRARAAASSSGSRAFDHAVNLVIRWRAVSGIHATPTTCSS